MADRIVPDEPESIVLHAEEWREIEACVMAFWAALKAGLEDEGEELIRSVYVRLSKAVGDVSNRLSPPD